MKKKESLRYNTAVLKLGLSLEDLGIDQFKASSILAILYNRTKEETMKDLDILREKVIEARKEWEKDEMEKDQEQKG